MRGYGSAICQMQVHQFIHVPGTRQIGNSRPLPMQHEPALEARDRLVIGIARNRRESLLEPRGQAAGL